MKPSNAAMLDGGASQWSKPDASTFHAEADSIEGEKKLYDHACLGGWSLRAQLCRFVPSGCFGSTAYAVAEAFDAGGEAEYIDTMDVRAIRKMPFLRCSLLVVLATLLAGCRSEESRPATKHETPPAPSTAQAPMLSKGLVKLLLEPALPNLTPEQVIKRFAWIELERTQPLPDSIELVGKVEAGFVKVGFFREDGRLEFTHLRLDVPATTVEEAGEKYEKLLAAVRDKLGKPHLIQNDPPYLMQSYKLGTQLEVNVGAVKTFDEGQPYVALSVVVPGPS
jgi:hypothetical protein